jgi:hypothetical protein
LYLNIIHSGDIVDDVLLEILSQAGIDDGIKCVKEHYFSL